MKVFKGIVNGKKFDNDKDYQQAIAKAINNKKSVVASSRFEEVVDNKIWGEFSTLFDDDQFFGDFLFTKKMLN